MTERYHPDRLLLVFCTSCRDRPARGCCASRRRDGPWWCRGERWARCRGPCGFGCPSGTGVMVLVGVSSSLLRCDTGKRGAGRTRSPAREMPRTFPLAIDQALPRLVAQTDGFRLRCDADRLRCRDLCPTGKSLPIFGNHCQAHEIKNISLYPKATITATSHCHPVPARGAHHDRHDRGAGRDGRWQCR